MVDLSFTRERLAEARREGVRVITGMTLDPGRYQLRVAVGIRNGRVRSVIRDIAIPNYTESPLAMSSVSLTSQLATAMPTTSRANFLSLSLGGPVTARREFSRRDEITVYAEVYENEILARHMVELRTVAQSRRRTDRLRAQRAAVDARPAGPRGLFALGQDSGLGSAAG